MKGPVQVLVVSAFGSRDPKLLPDQLDIFFM